MWSTWFYFLRVCACVCVSTLVAVVVRITGHQSSSVKVRRENKTLSLQPVHHSSDLDRSKGKTHLGMMYYFLSPEERLQRLNTPRQRPAAGQGGLDVAWGESALPLTAALGSLWTEGESQSHCSSTQTIYIESLRQFKAFCLSISSSPSYILTRKSNVSSPFHSSCDLLDRAPLTHPTP